MDLAQAISVLEIHLCNKSAHINKAWDIVHENLEAVKTSHNKQRVQCEHHFVPLKRVVKHCVKCAIMEIDGLHYTRL